MADSTKVYSWGAGLHGQLGLGSDTLAVSTPTEIVDLRDAEVSFVTANGDVSAVVTRDGYLIAWGKTKGGVLPNHGHAFTANLMQPSEIDIMGVKFESVALGRSHSAGVTKDGKVVTWGNAQHGKLGIKETAEEKKGYRPSNYAEQTEQGFVYGDLETERIKQVTCGFHHTVALSNEGKVFAWGNGKDGALGLTDYE
jgi:RCC1 and BTB domain-containing protein